MAPLKAKQGLRLAPATKFVNVAVDWLELVDVGHVFKLDLPGSTTEDLSVQVLPGNLLQISGELKKGSYGGGTSWGEWHTVERPGGVFLRQFQIEGDIRVDEIEVVAQDGVLTITIPKKRPLVRTIPIASVL